MNNRALLLDGKSTGIIKRVPKISGEIRTNMRLAEIYEPAEINDRGHEICNKIGPELEKRGLTF
ncbi:Prokaryotic glutathione synthetase, ATP-binding [Cinara cedri]|uniref:Prokaryotic glutathione synthetase, ATP-binding n=1 Tax=Cinara cedri TaxID=506608 RepID=A0A5E4ND52_9HEMI|nr:Prokaryotic glutathione synthetase, ATP-binding [Cinara cedri]